MIADLAVVTGVAAVTSILSRRIGQPSILGYLMAGLIVGPYIPIPLFADPARMHELSEVGVILVMFAVGLEFRVGRLFEILPVSGLTAAVQIGTLWCCGYGVGAVLGWSDNASVCLGAMLAISSTMVVSGVLATRPVETDTRAHVFGVLIVQDLVAIVLMAVVTAIAAGQSMELSSFGALVGRLAGAVALILVVAVFVLPRLVRFALKQGDDEVVVVLVAAAAFGLAMAAHAFGYSVALGAFLAGMAVAESGRGHEIGEAIAPLRALFSAIFFVSIGMSVDPLVAWRNLPLALVLCSVVVVGQFSSVLAATVLTGSSLRKGVYAGLALGQIGELSFILATIAIAGGVVPDETLPVLVTVATLTALSTSLLLARAQRVVEKLDHWVPPRVHQSLAAYQAFLRRVRTPGGGAALRQPGLGVVLDWAALVLLYIGRSAAMSQVGVSLRATVNGVALLLAAPFLVGLVRSGRQLGAVVRNLARGGRPATPRARAVEGLALLAVLLGVGLPTVALLLPFVSGHWLEVMFSGALLVVLMVVVARLSRVRDTQASGVAQIARRLAENAAGVDEDLAGGSSALAGVDALAGLDYHALELPVDARLDGQDLSTIDLRAHTGATLVAIQRDQETVVMPAGESVLHGGDVLAICGSDEAIERARTLLLAFPEPGTDETPS